MGAKRLDVFNERGKVFEFVPGGTEREDLRLLRSRRRIVVRCGLGHCGLNG